MSAIAKMMRDAAPPARIEGYVCASCNETLTTRPALNEDWNVCPYCGTPLHPIIYETPDDGRWLLDKGADRVARVRKAGQNGREDDA